MRALMMRTSRAKKRGKVLLHALIEYCSDKILESNMSPTGLPFLLEVIQLGGHLLHQ